MGKRADRLALASLVGVWAIVVALVGLGGDYALNDDWAYASTARRLLHTGELRISEWAAPSLVTHAIWGAAALRILGDTHVALRAGTLAWALLAILCVYGLARRAALAPGAATVASLALGLSPWFVNLSFTYMTDVPWLAMMLAALLVFSLSLRPDASPRPLLLALSGAIVGAAALSRQFALVTTPAFAAVIVLDRRRRAVDGGPGAPPIVDDGGRAPQTPREEGLGLPAVGPTFDGPVVRACLLFGAPVAALFLSFQIWYSRVHGATQANREAFGRILAVRPSHVLDHATCVIHYAGLWIFPLALALLFTRQLGAVLTRRRAAVAILVLGGSALRMFLRDPGLAGMSRPDASIHPLMPYLGNIGFLVGLGPPTVSDVFWGAAPLPHAAPWLGVPLTLASTLGGVVGAGLLSTVISRIRSAGVDDGGGLGLPAVGPTFDRRPALVRALLAGFAGTYLLWHLSTATFLFDRYLLPLLPVVAVLGIDAAPPHLARSPVALACLVACLLGGGLSAAALTREYLSWNDARDHAVRALVARGVPAAEIDAGFEPNAGVYFEGFLRRTGKLLESGSFWVTGAPYRISFWPSRTPECATLARYPYWTWPGGGAPAIYALHCGSPAGASP